MPGTFGTSSSVCKNRATEFFKLQSDPEMDNLAYVAKIEKKFLDMNTELRRRGSHDIPTELLHGPVGSEYQKFSNVWESLDDNKQTMKSA
jgi:hypothetical protein